MVANLSSVVVDTSVVSIIYNQDSRAPYYESRLEGLRALISFQTLEESWRGAYLSGWGESRRKRLEAYLSRYEVVWPGPGLVDVCARLRTSRQQAGQILSATDAWIAATALLMRCPLAADDGDFAGIPNLQLIRAPLR